MDQILNIDLNNLVLTSYPEFGIRQNIYPFEQDGRRYWVELLQPIKRTSKVYDVCLCGGDEVEYLDSIDLNSTPVLEAEKYIRRELEKYIKRNK